MKVQFGKILEMSVSAGIVSCAVILTRLKTATLMEGIIFETDRITAQFVLGFFNPRIYLPAGIDNADCILKHERTHIRRRDHIVKPAAFCALCLHWFNPVIWLSYYLMCRDMEMSCDESVLRHSLSDIRKDYSGSLLALSIKQNGLSGPLAFGEGNTKKRVRNVMKYRKPSFWLSAAAVLIMLCMAACFAPNRSENSASPPPEPPSPSATAPEPEVSPSVQPEALIAGRWLAYGYWEVNENWLKIGDMQIIEDDGQNIASRFEFDGNGRFIYTNYNGNTSEGSYATYDTSIRNIEDEYSVYTLTYDEAGSVLAASKTLEYNEERQELEYQTDSGITCFRRVDEF